MSIDNVLDRVDIPRCDTYGSRLSTDERLALFIKEFYHIRQELQYMTSDIDKLKRQFWQLAEYIGQEK